MRRVCLSQTCAVRLARDNKPGLDVSMSAIGFAAPIGFTISGIYYVIHVTIGWPAAIKSSIEIEKNKATMRKEKILNFSDFKNWP